MYGILQNIMELMKISKVLYENDDLKLIESENIYFLESDSRKMRVVFDGECRINRVCVVK